MKVFFRVLVSFVLLGILFFVMRDDLPRIGETLKNVNPAIFVAAFAVTILAILILARRLQLVFSAQEMKLKISDAVNLSFLGFFFNNFLPTAVGGDVVKIMCASKLTKQPVKCVSLVLMDRIFGLFTFILIPSLSFLAFAGEMKHGHIALIIYSFLAASIICFLFLFNRGLARKFGFIKHVLRFLRIEDKVRSVYDGMNGFSNHKGIVIEALLLSVISQLLSIASRYLVVLSVGCHPEPLHFLLLVPIVDLISMAPSLNGLGVREWGYIYLLSPYIGREYAAALGVLWLAVLFGLSLIGGLIYLFKPQYHVHFKEKKIERSIKEAL